MTGEVSDEKVCKRDKNSNIYSQLTILGKPTGLNGIRNGDFSIDEFLLITTLIHCQESMN